MSWRVTNISLNALLSDECACLCRLSPRFLSSMTEEFFIDPIDEFCSFVFSRLEVENIDDISTGRGFANSSSSKTMREVERSVWIIMTKKPKISLRNIHNTINSFCTKVGSLLIDDSFGANDLV